MYEMRIGVLTWGVSAVEALRCMKSYQEPGSKFGVQAAELGVLFPPTLQPLFTLPVMGLPLQSHHSQLSLFHSVILMMAFIWQDPTALY
jgi:hypothetical protein